MGRRHERGEVKRLPNASRLVTLTGPGGTGKTRLAARTLDEVPPPAGVGPARANHILTKLGATSRTQWQPG